MSNCQSYNAEYGFEVWGGAAEGCYANSCTTDFRNTGYGKLTNCDSLACGTVNLQVQQVFAPAQGVQSSASATPSLTFDPTCGTNVYTFTYSGTIGTFTLNWPAAWTALPPGAMYTVVIAAKSGTGITAVSFPIFMRMQAGTLAVSSGHSQSAQFMVTSDGAHLAQITAWVDNPNGGWV